MTNVLNVLFHTAGTSDLLGILDCFAGSVSIFSRFNADCLVRYLLASRGFVSMVSGSSCGIVSVAFYSFMLPCVFAI